jgi:hypothetical protein
VEEGEVVKSEANKTNDANDAEHNTNKTNRQREDSVPWRRDGLEREKVYLRQ